MTKLAIFQLVLFFSLTAQMPPVTATPPAEKSSNQAETAQEPVFYFPVQVTFWNASSGLSRTERIFLRQGDEHPLKIKSVLTDSDNISAEIVKSGGKEKLTYTIAVNLDPKTPPGPVSGKVIIKTDNPKAETISIPVIGNVLDDIAVTPPMLTIRLKKANGEGRSVVSITSTNGKKFKVQEAKVALAEVKTDIKTISEGKVHLILVSVTEPDKSKREPKQTLLYVKVDTPQKMIVIPVTILP